MKNLLDEDRNYTMDCGCVLHQFDFGGIVEMSPIKRCGKKDCIIEQKLKNNT
jgi:hypothetical protein